MNKVLKGIMCVVSSVIFLGIMFLVMCGLSFLLENASSTVQHVSIAIMTIGVIFIFSREFYKHI